MRARVLARVLAYLLRAAENRDAILLAQISSFNCDA